MYDSKEEKQFHQRNSFLNTSHDFFSTTFKDSEGVIFGAKPDFIYNDQVYIEFKCQQLNNHETKAKAESRIANQISHGKNEHFAKLQHGFNHSVFKQGIVAAAYPDRFLLVFKDGTKMSTQAKNKLTANGVPWCYESEMLDTLEAMAGKQQPIRKPQRKATRRGDHRKSA